MWVDFVELRRTREGQSHEQTTAIGRPSWCTVGATLVRGQATHTGGHLMGVDNGLLLFKRHISQASTIGRPVGRNDGLGAAEHRLGVLPIGVGQPQVVTTTRARGVRNARGKHAGHTGHSLENIVGDAVGRRAQVLRGDGVADTAQTLVAQHVPQTVTHIPSTAGQGVDTADHHHVHATAAPRAQVGLAAFIQRAMRQTHMQKLAAALQVGSNDGGDVLGYLRTAPKNNG